MKQNRVFIDLRSVNTSQLVLLRVAEVLNVEEVTVDADWLTGDAVEYCEVRMRDGSIHCVKDTFASITRKLEEAYEC